MAATKNSKPVSSKSVKPVNKSASANGTLKASCKPARIPAVTIGRDEYKGNPMIVFSRGEDDRFPFQFGGGKAATLLDAIASVGVDALIAELVDVAGDRLDPATAAALGVKAPKPCKK